MRNGPTPRFDHSAFLYDTDEAYLAILMPFIREGLSRGEGVAVAAGPDRITLLRDALQSDAATIRFITDAELYVRPVRAIAGWARMLTGGGGRPPFTRLVGQVRFGPAEQHPAWIRFESALNRALADRQGHLLCPYDRRLLPADVVDTAGRTHPVLCDGRWSDSDTYLVPEQLLTEVVEPPYPVRGDPLVVLPVTDTVAGLREHVRTLARTGRWLHPDRLEDLILAISEITTNSVRHGGGRRELQLWLTGEAVVCEVSDEGPNPPGPLAGYLPPRPDAVGGMGLWLVHQVCDSLTIRTSGGTTRARFAILR